MRLEYLMNDVADKVLEKMQDRDMDKDEAYRISRIVGMAAVKYGDLSNQATKDYVCDLDRFASFEGNTGPYILYTIVRIKSILRRAEEADLSPEKLMVLTETTESLKSLMKALASFPEMIVNAAEDLAPHRICSYLYQVCDAFNSFYHETQILKEEDQERREAYLSLLKLTLDILNTCINILGFTAPEKM